MCTIGFELTLRLLFSWERGYCISVLQCDQTAAEDVCRFDDPRLETFFVSNSLSGAYRLSERWQRICTSSRRTAVLYDRGGSH